MEIKKNIGKLGGQRIRWTEDSLKDRVMTTVTEDKKSSRKSHKWGSRRESASNLHNNMIEGIDSYTNMLLIRLRS